MSILRTALRRPARAYLAARAEAGMLRSALITKDVWPGYGKPFNGQRNRLQTIRQLITAYEPDVFAETGTFLGHTTRFFLGQGVPVWTIEAKLATYLIARARLGVGEDLTFLRGNSPELVRRLRAMGFHRPFFYLDAHWWSELPLAEELREIAAGWDNAVIVIDDCQVPDDDGYGFDTYLGAPLSAERLPFSDDMVIGYPAEPSDTEVGARRGALYIAHGTVAARALDGVTSIRRDTARQGRVPA